jgi:hypothetical protein
MPGGVWCLGNNGIDRDIKYRIDNDHMCSMGDITNLREAICYVQYIPLNTSDQRQSDLQHDHIHEELLYVFY